MAIIIHGASGAQGAPVAAALIRSGKTVIAAVRNPDSYPGSAVAVDYNEVESLRLAYEGAEGVFVHLPLGSPEQQLAYAHAIVEAVDQARPARVVVSTSGYLAEDEEKDASAIGVLVKGLRATGVSTAAIAPRIYLENLLRPPVTEPARHEGVLRYPIREDYAVSWCSHLDIADVAVRLFEDDAVTGTVTVGALPGLLGSDLAAGFGRYFEREVRFETQEPEEMGAAIAPLFGEEAIAPVVASYHYRRTQPDELINQANSAQARLGIQPRSVEQWLRDVQA